MAKGFWIFYLSLIVTLLLWGGAKLAEPHLLVIDALVQILGLLGIMLLAWTFVLAVRTKWLENLFGGLDKAYKLHHIAGGIAFVALANHVGFLILKSLPSNMTALYLLPGKDFSYNLGQLAFYTMLVLLSLTLYINLPYRLWKLTHEWMGLVIIFGGLHAMLVTSDTTSYLPLRIWILLWSMLAAAAYIYKRFVYYFYPRPVKYTIERNGTAGELLVLNLTTRQKPLNFGPGQYGFFALPSHPRDEHAFSVIAQSGNKLTLGIRIYANFTKRLAALREESTVMVRGPFGKFAQKAGVPHCIYIAGGIGITPFLSMASSITSDQKVEMFFSARKMPHPVLTSPFEKIAQSKNNFKFVKHETEGKERLSARRILEETGNDKNAYYFLCGPTVMMETMAEDLARAGIRRSHIIYEDFAFK